MRGRSGRLAAGGAAPCRLLPVLPLLDGPGWERGVILLIPLPPEGDVLFLPLLPSPDCDDVWPPPIPLVDAASACAKGRVTIRNSATTMRHARTNGTFPVCTRMYLDPFCVVDGASRT